MVLGFAFWRNLTGPVRGAAPALLRAGNTGNVARVSPPVPRFNVLGTAVSALSLDQARDLIVARAPRHAGGYVCCATAYNVQLARDLPQLRTAYNRSVLTTPDGMPLVWLAHWHRHRQVTRVYGPDLLLAVCDAGRATGLRHFFYGGAEGVAENLAMRLATKFPGLQVVGTHTPPFRPLAAKELDDLRNQVAAAAPHVVWIGLSSPKQELFMAEHSELFGGAVLLGVGAAFDFHSGRVRQAPLWMQRGGLEWLHRLGSEPGRLWRRYLIQNPRFVANSTAQLLGLRRFPLEG